MRWGTPRLGLALWGSGRGGGSKGRFGVACDEADDNAPVPVFSVLCDGASDDWGSQVL